MNFKLLMSCIICCATFALIYKSANIGTCNVIVESPILISSLKDCGYDGLDDIRYGDACFNIFHNIDKQHGLYKIYKHQYSIVFDNDKYYNYTIFIASEKSRFADGDQYDCVSIEFEAISIWEFYMLNILLSVGLTIALMLVVEMGQVTVH